MGKTFNFPQWAPDIAEMDANLAGIVSGCVPRADGYARYMIMREKPFAMIHLMLGDAWCAEPEWERGMRLSDARKRIEGERKFRAAWAEAK